MGKTNEQVMEAELKRLKGPFYKPPLTRDELAASMRLLCQNPIPIDEVEKFLRDKKLIP